MKKNLFPLLALLPVATVLFSCTSSSPAEQSACDQLHAESFYGQAPEGYITLQMAKDLTGMYYADLAKSNISEGGKVTGQQDARSVWYSLKTLKQYIWQIEDTLCKQGCNLDSLDLGIHFYFAKYPDAEHIKEYGVDTSYANHQTLLVTATYKDGKTNVDFDPYHIGGEKCKPTPLKSYMMQAKTSEGMRMSGATEDPGVLNHGTLIPPPYGDGSFPSGN